MVEKVFDLVWNSLFLALPFFWITAQKYLLVLRFLGLEIIIVDGRSWILLLNCQLGRILQPQRPLLHVKVFKCSQLLRVLLIDKLILVHLLLLQTAEDLLDWSDLELVCVFSACLFVRRLPLRANRLHYCKIILRNNKIPGGFQLPAHSHNPTKVFLWIN